MLTILIGLGTNVGLTITKGLAGIFMNSAALVAEAGHSLSDLLGVSATKCSRDSQLNDLPGYCDPHHLADIEKKPNRQLSAGVQQV